MLVPSVVTLVLLFATSSFEVASPEYCELVALSPVFVPLTTVVPVTARVGVEAPDRTTLFTLVGVIAPSVIVIAGVLVAVATDPDTPFAVVTETEVTVPAHVEAVQADPVHV